MTTISYNEYCKKLGYNTREKHGLVITKVIFNYPATVVLWEDGTKTVVKCKDDEPYDPEKGLVMAIAKKALGNEGNYYNTIRKWVDRDENYLTLITGGVLCDDA